MAVREDMLMGLDRPRPHWLYRCDDRSPYAYERGGDLIRCADHTVWAHLHGDGIYSARSGARLAVRRGAVFCDAVSDEPLYYEQVRTGCD